MEFAPAQGRLTLNRPTPRPQPCPAGKVLLQGQFRNKPVIAVVTETWRPDINGVAMTCGKIVDGLASLGAEIHLFQTVAEDKLDEPDLTVHSIRGIKLPFYRDVKLGRPCSARLTRAWQKQRPDIVLIVTEGLLGHSAMKAATALGIPVFSEYHTNFQQYTRFYGVSLIEKLVNAHLRRFHNRAELSFVPTDEIRQSLSQQGYTNLVTVARGVDTELFSPQRRSQALRRQWGLADDDPAVLYVGRLAAEKNIDLAIRAFRRVQLLQPRARFILVGDGPVRQRLQREHPDFIYCGMQRGEDLACHYASADLFVFPSLSETFGNVLIEALASGLPAVAFDYAAAKRHVRDHYNARSVPPGNEEAFLRAASDLATEPQTRRSLGAHARISMLDNSWEAVYRRLAAIIRARIAQEDDA
ncbi:glycosyltransferase family 1 protein [Granulosicoccaceae sp. 1_MG-2023]|nr:glycosyltransferase family 1 protein [Granulosicoccaceae sp. 1_MG-2023]